MATVSMAVVWNAVRVVGQSGLGLIVSMILARLLVPEDFGLMALAMVYIAFSEMVASVGLSSAIVQRKELTQTHINVGQTLALLIGTALLLFFWGTADGAAALFENDRLAELVPFMAISIWLSIIASVSRGLLMRDMNFKQLMIIDFTAHALGYALVSVSMALMGYGVWSLVVGTTVSAVITSAWLFYSAPVRFSLSLSRKEVKQLFAFSSGMALNNVIGFLSMKSGDIIISKFLGDRSLGLFSRAANTASIPFMKIALTISSVMFSAYAEIQDNKDRLREQYLKAVRLVSATAIPVLSGLWICGEYVIVGMYGDQWIDAVVIFQIACVGGMFNNVLHLAGAVVQATNNVYKEVWYQSYSLVFLVVGLLLIAQAELGIHAMVWMMVASSVLLYLLMAALVIRLIDSSWLEYVAAQLPGLVLSIPVLIVDYVVIQFIKTIPDMPTEIGLFILIGVSAVTYLLAMLYFPDRWIGGIRNWVLDRYGHRLPAFMR